MAEFHEIRRFFFFYTKVLHAAACSWIIFLGLLKAEYRSNHWRSSIRKGAVLEISQNSQENTCASLFFNKVAGLTPANLLKQRLWHRCFPVNFVTFLRAPLSQNTSGRLLLWIVCKNNFYKLGMNNLYDSVQAMKIWKPIVSHTSCIIQIV